jgi:hypothetical protein
MSQASKKMVVGFNHNIKHKGQVYHVQTEDSGVENPHIITHLFVGGNILASRKTSYAAFLASKDLEKVVRTMMEDQHKEILRKLVAGAFDGAAGNGAAAPSFQPGEVAHAASVPPHVPVRPAAGTPEPSSSPDLGALFGEDLISEKSLDEVILSYLAEEMDPKTGA